MGAVEIVGGTLVAGLAVFFVGAAGWRMAYEAPLEEALTTIHGDRRRRTWIHGWMLPAMFLTAAGLAALPVLLEDPTARVLAVLAATVFALGAVCWVLSLAFRLTVVPAAAADLVEDGTIPHHFRPLDAWASSMYAVHMTSAYAAAALLGAALLTTDGIAPTWLGWTGVGFGALWLAGFLATRFAGPFNPPFWAHLFTGAVGIALLL